MHDQPGGFDRSVKCDLGHIGHLQHLDIHAGEIRDVPNNTVERVAILATLLNVAMTAWLPD